MIFPSCCLILSLFLCISFCFHFSFAHRISSLFFLVAFLFSSCVHRQKDWETICKRNYRERKQEKKKHRKWNKNLHVIMCYRSFVQCESVRVFIFSCFLSFSFFSFHFYPFVFFPTDFFFIRLCRRTILFKKWRKQTGRKVKINGKRICFVILCVERIFFSFSFGVQ